MRLPALLLMLLLARPLWAQDSVIVIDPNARPSDSFVRGGPPADVVGELIAFYNDSSTTRMQGDVTLPPGSRFQGKLALYRGSLRIAGRVTGPIAVANGTLYLLPGASVDGDILVVGGRLLRSEQVEHRGPERVYWDAAPIIRGSDGLLALRERRRSLGDIATARATFQVGRVRTTLSLGTGGTYNRIEGLPILFGPLFEYRPSDRGYVRLDIRGILRTAGGSTDLRSDFGYVARADVRFAGKREFGFAGQLYNQVSPIEEQPLSIGEVGWAAFLAQRDYRDYYEREGGSTLAYIKPIPALRFEVSLGWEAQRSVRANDPWTLFRNSDRWRRNPLIDDGHFFSGAVLAEFDTRNDRDRPTTGWMLRSQYEHLTSDDIAPVALPGVVRPSPTGDGFATDRLLLDARRYTRLTPALRVNARVRAEGWIAGDRLPVQRRVSLGGPDPLPGFDFRAFNCVPTGFSDPADPALCDRLISTQVEVRTRLGLNLGYRLPERENRPGRFIGIEEADLVLFSDAGKSWLAGDGPGQVPVNKLPVLSEWSLDLGVGLDAGEIGAYLAKSISSDESVKLVFRLQRRF